MADFRSSNKRLREIAKEISKLEARSSQLNREMIAAGRGNERPSEYNSKTDPLSKEMNQVSGKSYELRSEATRIYGPGWNPGYEIRGSSKDAVLSWASGNHEINPSGPGDPKQIPEPERGLTGVDAAAQFGKDARQFHRKGIKR